MRRLTGIAALLSLVVFSAPFALGRSPSKYPGNKEKSLEAASPGPPKGMELYERARLGQEDMEGVVMMDEEQPVPPGEVPPSDMPQESEDTTGGAAGQQSSPSKGKP